MHSFRPKAPRIYELRVLAGSGISDGVVYTSAADAIPDVGGAADNGAPADIALSVEGLTDHTLEPGESVQFLLAFSGGAGDGSGGHDLFVDNVAISGALTEFTALQSWRLDNFGIIENTGTAADDYDANFDGENNLLEFATGQDPHAATLIATPVMVDGSELEFRYTRSKAALTNGFTFTVVWSDTLQPGSWSSVGVTEIIDPENPGNSEVENRIATVPAGSAGKRFVRLRVNQP